MYRIRKFRPFPFSLPPMSGPLFADVLQPYKYWIIKTLCLTPRNNSAIVCLIPGSIQGSCVNRNVSAYQCVPLWRIEVTFIWEIFQQLQFFCESCQTLLWSGNDWFYSSPWSQSHSPLWLCINYLCHNKPNHHQCSFCSKIQIHTMIQQDRASFSNDAVTKCTVYYSNFLMK